MKGLSSIIFPYLLFLIVLNPACTSPPESPHIEFLPLDYTVRIVRNNIYYQPRVVFTKDYWPIVEYQFDRAWIHSVFVNFYLKNIGGTGEVELSAKALNEKTKSFLFESGKRYVVRVFITMGTSPPWPGLGGSTSPLHDYPVSVTVGEVSKDVTYASTFLTGSDLQSILIEELPPEITEVSPDDLPDEQWLVDAIWACKFDKCILTESFVKFRADGLFATKKGRPQDFTFDDTHRWKIDGDYLVLNYNNYMIMRYKLTSKDVRFFKGNSNRGEFPLRLEQVDLSQYQEETN